MTSAGSWSAEVLEKGGGGLLLSGSVQLDGCVEPKEFGLSPLNL